MEVSSEFSPLSLERARHRLVQIAIGVGVASLVFRPLAVLHLAGLDAAAYVELGIVLVIGLALDASLYLVARDPAVPNEKALDFGLLYQVLRCFSVSVSMVRFDGLAGLEPPAITFAFVPLILFPLLVPTRPLKTVLVALLAASLQPLVLVSFSPVPVPELILAHSILASGVAVAFAVLGGRIGYALLARASYGAELGSYRLEELLHRDGTGELWRASHRLLARPAAVKMIRPTLLKRRDSSASLRKFRSEAVIAATLTSPYTVTLYDYGVSDAGWTYSAMELLDGVSLSKWVTLRGPQALSQVMTMITRVCDSLAEAHEAGLVHGDLTPNRVYVCRVGLEEDYVKVAGFGRLRAPPHTDTGEAESEERWPDFVPPEIASGGRESPSTDIYQIGCLLEFLLARLPRKATVPAAVHHIVDRCLAIDPKARFTSARSVLDELGGFSGARDRVLPRRRTSRQVRRRRSRASGASTPFLEKERVLLTVAPERGQRGTVLRRRTQQSTRHRVHSQDVLEAARHRLAQVGLICASAGCTALALAGILGPAVADASKLPAVLGTGLFAVSLDVGLLLASRAQRLSTPVMLRLAVAYFVVRCWMFGVVVTQVYAMYGLTAPRVTFGAIFLVLLPAFVPLTPRQLILPCLVMILGRVVTLWWLTPVGYLGWNVVPAYLALTAFTSMYAAYVMTSLNVAASSGSTYGAYRLTSLIGRGGMGEVWSARHELLARPAAVKLIRHLVDASPDERAARWRRFEKEAYATSLLTSPHTVTLYDYGAADDGTYYYVMELLDGETLRALVDRAGPLTAEQTIAVARQVCDSLGEAHARGIVHRDLKPENLFLTRAGCDPCFVKVLDFGLVSFVRNELNTQASGSVQNAVLGTPAYMSPEALFGRKVDERSDLYQLGCVLYFLLTGSAPFRGTNLVALAWAQVRAPAPRASASSPHLVPEALDDVIACCLAKEPADRYGSATELRAALDTAASAVLVGDSGIAPRGRNTWSAPKGGEATQSRQQHR